MKNSSTWFAGAIAIMLIAYMAGRYGALAGAYYTCVACFLGVTCPFFKT